MFHFLTSAMTLVTAAGFCATAYSATTYLTFGRGIHPALACGVAFSLGLALGLYALSLYLITSAGHKRDRDRAARRPADALREVV